MHPSITDVKMADTRGSFFPEINLALSGTQAEHLDDFGALWTSHLTALLKKALSSKPSGLDSRQATTGGDLVRNRMAS